MLQAALLSITKFTLVNNPAVFLQTALDKAWLWNSSCYSNDVMLVSVLPYLDMG